jgi:hypothetical protein
LVCVAGDLSEYRGAPGAGKNSLPEIPSSASTTLLLVPEMEQVAGLEALLASCNGTFGFGVGFRQGRQTAAADQCISASNITKAIQREHEICLLWFVEAPSFQIPWTSHSNVCHSEAKAEVIGAEVDGPSSNPVL